MNKLDYKKTGILILFVFITILAIFNISKKNTNTSKADIKTTSTLATNTFNKNTASKIVPNFNLSLDSNIALIGNLKTGRVLFQKNADLKTNAASIAKLLSASVVLSKLNISNIININSSIYENLPSKTDLVLDENIKVLDLLKMALIMSSNDAINALAYHIGYYDFLSSMNQKANEIGMYNSHFDNPIGFDSEGNYSTAVDLFQLAKYIYNNFPIVGDITRSNAITITSESNIKHLVVPTNLIVDKLENY